MRHWFKPLVLLFCACFIINTVSAAGKLDSLKGTLLPAPQGSEQCRILLRLADEYANSDKDSSLKFGKLAYSLSSKLKNEAQMAEARIYIGNSEIFFKNYPEATDNLLRATQYYESHNNTIGLGKAWFSLARLYMEIPKYEQVELYGQKCWDLALKTGDLNTRVNAANVLAICAARKNNLTEAISILKNGLPYARKLGISSKIGSYLNNIGYWYLGLEQADSALKYHGLRLELAITEKNKIDIAFGYLNFGALYLFKKQYAEARKNLLLSLRIAEEGKNVSVRLDVLATLHQVEAGSANYKQALYYLNEIESINDSLAKINAWDKVSAMETKLSEEIKQKEDAYRASEAKLKEIALAKEKQKNKALIVILSILVIIPVLIFVQNRRLIKAKNKLALQGAALEKQNISLDMAVKELHAAQVKLVRQEKMASLGQLTAGIAHEINNPINFISGNINPLLRDIEDMNSLLENFASLSQLKDYRTQILQKLEEIQREMLDMDWEETSKEISGLLHGMEQGASRTVEIVQGLNTFSKLDDNIRQAMDVNIMIEEALGSIIVISDDSVEVHKDFGELPLLLCFPAQLSQVFKIIFDNALEAINGKGEIHIKTQQEKDKILISIRDNGIGMPPEIQKRIFEPFFTTREVGKGKGLGLSLAYSILKNHRGKIDVISTPGMGAEFKLEIPMPIED